MKSSLVTLAFFLFGCVAGVSYAVDFDVHQTSVYVLYVLMLLLGINLGSNRNLRQFVLSLNFRTLLVPLATVSGTLLFSAIGGFLLSRWSIFDCMAVGSGFSYYSVSSILITQIKSPSIGVQLATELGTIALLSNIFREMTALIGAPPEGSDILYVTLHSLYKEPALSRIRSRVGSNTSARLKHFFLTIRSFLSINYYRLSQQTVQSITSDRTVHYNGLYDSL